MSSGKGSEIKRSQATVVWCSVFELPNPDVTKVTNSGSYSNSKAKERPCDGSMNSVGISRVKFNDLFKMERPRRPKKRSDDDELLATCTTYGCNDVSDHSN